MDREKVIKAYENFVNGYECFCTSDDIEYEMHKAVLALLKEQQQLIWELQEVNEHLEDKLKEQETANLYKCPNCGTWVSAENVVRCKDCKHYKIDTCSAGAGMAFPPPDDWFCADGERR